MVGQQQEGHLVGKNPAALEHYWRPEITVEKIV